jgi:hypothetical protein
MTAPSAKDLDSTNNTVTTRKASRRTLGGEWGLHFDRRFLLELVGSLAQQRDERG